MTINFHQIIHLPDTVLNLGNLWVYSNFFLEDMNGAIANLVHGSRHAAMQICCSVSAFLTLPVRIRSLPENSRVRACCEKMLAGGQRQVKVSAVLDRKTFVVGQFALCNPFPQYISEALANFLNINGGRCKYFYKLKKKGIIYVANNYPRVAQKLSSYALVSNDDNVPLLCRIECFIKWTPCNDRCARACICAPRFLCITRLYERIPWEIHYVRNVRMSYLSKVRLTNQIRAFTVESVRMPCFYIDNAGCEYIATPINMLEVE